ncbi:uncharacterized protein CTHT_0031450 [Thermochaetoides thermophila DSM 1495]|jgi:hypothetical protein|uniref:DUF7053 domain-containing protein n=1 Tax=Chaetomium thermophilum (strain DSM 1495 / CBS 144.50 / IMI 039719) TaxID=759272 RepID=G0S4L7_CHATD|nr:hypothetical protein CTHT_0031450 [Thermochaetoides thermophila DSM 1495]EGS21292.1 hypothetical protein CTHT_0031450 [Thermochaetoides thermophila DSM 1495]
MAFLQTRFRVINRVPIPSIVDPQAARTYLGTYESLITPNPYLERYELRTLDAAEQEEIRRDPFYPPNTTHWQGYTVYERVPIIPGAGDWATTVVEIPCIFLTSEYGVLCRGDATGGVTVKSRYEVRKRGEIQEGPDLVVGPGEEGDYELVDISEINCNLVVKPFVREKLSSGHIGILKTVVSKLVEQAKASAASF